MRRKGTLYCSGDIFSASRVLPLDYIGRRYCIFEEDAIMTQQTTPRLRALVAIATFWAAFTFLCSFTPVHSLGSECYTITGVDYRGNQDRIELPPSFIGTDFIQYTDCLPWNSSVESTRPRAREKGIGPHNHCRNPDEDVLPWCKVPGVAGADGAWGYCHLPKCKVPGYIGCFPDKGKPPALDQVSILHKSTTVGACLLFCRHQGHKYAGLEAGHACYCGDHGYNRYGKSAERGTHCSSKCFGNREQPCGGDGYVDVYRSHIGSCGSSSPLTERHGAVYSPGYPDYPASTAFMTSLNAASSMVTKLKEKMKDVMEVQEMDTSAMHKDKTCDWTINIKHAKGIKMLVRKIDPKRKLGGVIEIEAGASESLHITVPLEEITSSNTSSNETNFANVLKTDIKSTVVWIADSVTARGEVDVVIPDDVREASGKKQRPKWANSATSSKRYVIPSNTLQSMISASGSKFKVRFLQSPEMMTAITSALERHRLRSRRKSSGSEWSRYVLEYEATIPEGVPSENEEGSRGETSRRVTEPRRKHRYRGDPKRSGAPSDPEGPRQRPKSSNTSPSLQTEHGQTRFLISSSDAKAIKTAMTSDSDASPDTGSNSQLKIEVFVEPVPGELPDDFRGAYRQQMSEFTIPLLLAVLLTTTAVLILSAVLVILRRGGISFKKQEKARDIGSGLVVSCHSPDGGKGLKKSSSDSNLSSSSTADSLLLTDSDTSKYSPPIHGDNSPPVSPATIKNLIEILKGHPGILSRSPLDAEQYKQISQHPSYLGFEANEGCNNFPRDGARAPPGPCPCCCGCDDATRIHRHGDSCRSHQNHAKANKQSSQGGANVRSSGLKNPRGLTIKGCLKSSGGGVQHGMAMAPPLSPISEVSSVTSSMMSLPITTANSQTSLLSRSVLSPQNVPHRNVKNDDDVGSETEAFLPVESDAESGIGDMRSPDTDKSAPFMDRITKLRFPDNSKKISGRYQGGVTGACYDSGYATSNYEEEEEEKSGRRKENKNYRMLESKLGEQSETGNPPMDLITP